MSYATVREKIHRSEAGDPKTQCTQGGSAGGENDAEALGGILGTAMNTFGTACGAVDPSAIFQSRECPKLERHICSGGGDHGFG